MFILQAVGRVGGVHVVGLRLERTTDKWLLLEIIVGAADDVLNTFCGDCVWAQTLRQSIGWPTITPKTPAVYPASRLFRMEFDGLEDDSPTSLAEAGAMVPVGRELKVIELMVVLYFSDVC